jgi:hypothetical protein
VANNASGVCALAGSALTLTNCTIAGTGSGISGGATLVNTILATSGTNCVGGVTDLGHNLSSDGSCAFANPTSLNDTDPMLGPLADNGGGTLTMALLPGSPAIDAGDPLSAPPTDQRGLGRFGAAPDIGAFEYWPPPPAVQVNAAPGGGVNILASGVLWPTCRLFVSPNLKTWTVMATNQPGASGTARFHDAGGGDARFYRIVLP